MANQIMQRRVEFLDKRSTYKDALRMVNETDYVQFPVVNSRGFFFPSHYSCIFFILQHFHAEKIPPHMWTRLLHVVLLNSRECGEFLVNNTSFIFGGCAMVFFF